MQSYRLRIELPDEPGALATRGFSTTELARVEGLLQFRRALLAATGT